MALRKIKDLIREMIFENQSNEHEYANVMANLIFDRGHVDEYEEKLDIAEKIANDYDTKIQEINAELDKAKSNRDKIIAQKSEIPFEDFKTLMAQAQKTVKSLESTQQNTIAEKLQKGFRNLSPTIKKYGCLRYLANEYVKNSDFKTEIGKDRFLYTDEHAFKSSSIASYFREISDYVDYIFSNRESKITEPKSIVDIIRADAKELDLTIDKLTPEVIVNIYNSLLTRIANENLNKQTEQEQIYQSQIGIEPIRDFGDGLVMYRLLPDTEYYNEHGEHRNLVYESDQMGICIGRKGQSYSQNILEQDKNQYYTLRSRNTNGQLIPHCTIEVNGDVIHQVKGKANSIVTGKYIKQVREFLKKDLNCAFPGEENTENKRKLSDDKHDRANIGYVQDIYNKTVDLFNLPKDAELKSLTWELLNTKGIDTKHIKSIYNLDCQNKTLTQQDINTIAKFSVHTCNLGWAKLYGRCDLSNTNLKKFLAQKADLTNAEIIFNKDIEEINLSAATGLHGKLDLSELPNLKTIVLNDADCSNAEIIYSKTVENIHLTWLKLHGKQNFSKLPNLKVIYFNHADLTDAEIIFNKNIEKIDLSDATGLHGKLDFSNLTNLKEIGLFDTDLTNAEIIVSLNHPAIIGLDEEYKDKIIIATPTSKLDALNQGIINLKLMTELKTMETEAIKKIIEKHTKKSSNNL